jgi:predicted O-methyltransferase YrrM
MTMDDNSRRSHIESELRLNAPQISPEAFQLLAEMYSSEHLFGTESEEPVPIDKKTGITIAQGSQINQIMRAYNVQRSLEIGFAFGFSTIWILDALLDQKPGFHQAIDPFEKNSWRGVGLKQVERLKNANHKFRWLDTRSIHALSKLIEENEEFEFVFIDGSHRFDDALVDFYLADYVVRTGGLVAFDDMWMPSIRTVVSFVTNNRNYYLVEQPVRNMAVLEKTAPDSRNWRDFNWFEVPEHENTRKMMTKDAMVASLANIARQTHTYNLLRSCRNLFR